MSKSKGNVISALDTLDRYGDNAVRFYFLKEGPAGRDEAFSRMKLVDNFNAHVINDFGTPSKKLTSG